MKENWLQEKRVTTVKRIVRLEGAEALSMGARTNVFPMEVVIVHEMKNCSTHTHAWLIVGIPGVDGKLREWDGKVYATDLERGVFPPKIQDIIDRSEMRDASH